MDKSEKINSLNSLNDTLITMGSLAVILSLTFLASKFSLTATLTLVSISFALSLKLVKNDNESFYGVILCFGYVAGAFFSGYIFPYYLINNLHLFKTINPLIPLIAGSLISILAAFHYWKLFRVPIAVTIYSSILVFFILHLLDRFFFKNDFLLVHLSIVLSGFLFFLFAIYWDIKDKNRENIENKVALWLHLLSAFLIIHPGFKLLSHFFAHNHILNAITFISILAVFIIISLLINRRSLIILSFFYFILTVRILIKIIAPDVSSLAISALLTGLFVLCTTYYWDVFRIYLKKYVPGFLHKYVAN